MKVCQLLDLQEHTSSFLINIRASLIFEQRWAESLGKTPRYSGQVPPGFSSFSFFFFESQRRHFSRYSAGKDDLVCLRVGLSSIDSRGTLVGGPPPSSSSSRQCHDISNFPGAQGSLSKVDSNTLMIKKVQKRTRSWNWKWLQNQIKLSRPFLQGFARFRLRSKCTCCLGNSRCWTVDEKSSICHDYPLVCPCFFATRFLLLFRSHFCRNCSFTRRYQHDSVLELFLHFGRRTIREYCQFHGGLAFTILGWTIPLKIRNWKKRGRGSGFHWIPTYTWLQIYTHMDMYKQNYIKINIHRFPQDALDPNMFNVVVFFFLGFIHKRPDHKGLNILIRGGFCTGPKTKCS